MEQKAKRIGKFNIIDIIAVILILAVLAFVGWKLMNRGGGADGGETPMTKVTYVVRQRGFRRSCMSPVRPISPPR